MSAGELLSNILFLEKKKKSCIEGNVPPIWAVDSYPEWTSTRIVEVTVLRETEGDWVSDDTTVPHNVAWNIHL